MNKSFIFTFFILISWSLYAQPTISSFTPTNGPIGISVTITGTGFDSTPANNIVFFGATQAIVTAATTTELIVTVPTGTTYQPITVLVNGLIAYSSAPFVVTFGGSGIDANSFTTKMDFTTDTGPQSVASVDLDGDGKADLAIANFSTVSVLRNIGTSAGTINYATKVDYATGTSSWSISAGDLDGDGKFDLAVANNNSNTISVFRNTSTSRTINFATKIDYNSGPGPASVAIGDLDGDGKADLAVANFEVQTVSVFKNMSASVGEINYATKVDYTVGLGPRTVSIGDLDGDDKAELVIANSASNTVSILRNTSTSAGTINYTTKVDISTGTTPVSVAIGDLDGDGKADLAVTNVSSNTVSVFRNTSTSVGTISFAAKVDYVTGSAPRPVSIGDIDGDGKADMSVGNFFDATISIFRNTSTSAGTISFDTKVDYTTGERPHSISIGDLDGDGKADLAVGNTISATVSVFRNTILSTITAILIEEFNNLHIYPNPSRGEIFISGLMNKPHVITILDASGRNVKTFDVTGSSEYQLNIEDLNPGIYFLTIGDEKKSFRVMRK